MIKEYDSVIQTHDFPGVGLLKSQLGAVIRVYADKESYKVEFVTAEAKTVAVLTLTSQDSRLMRPYEILHPRGLQA